MVYFLSYNGDLNITLSHRDKERQMASSTVANRHFEVDGNKFTFFGLSGMPMGGGNWAMNGFFGSVMVEVDPAPVSSQIEEIIEQDRAAGNEEKIEHVLMNSRTALRLALEGRLPREALTAATETEDSIVLTLELGG